MKMQLFYEFISLSKLLNFTQAAQKLHMTQPVLSRHMKQLECEFGVELFLRDTHGVQLTSAGELFVEEAKKIIHQYESSLSAINMFTGKSRRSIKVSFLGEAVGSVLAQFLNLFRKDYSDVVIECQDSELDEAIDSLENQTSDLGFLVRPNFLENKLNSLYIESDSLCAAVNKKHPLACRKRVSLKDVVKWPLIRVNPCNFNLSELYSTNFLNRYNIPFTLYHEYPNLKTCCFNLEFNDQIALLMPKHRQYLLGTDSVLLDLVEDDFWFELEVVWDKKNTNPCTFLFLKEFKKFLAENQTDDLQTLVTPMYQRLSSG